MIPIFPQTKPSRITANLKNVPSPHKGIHERIVRDDIPLRNFVKHTLSIHLATGNRIDMNEGVTDEYVGYESKPQCLGVKGLGEGERRELRRSLQGEGEGVEVGRDGEAAHLTEEKESLEGKGEKGVASNGCVEAEAGWARDVIKD